MEKQKKKNSSKTNEQQLNISLYFCFFFFFLVRFRFVCAAPFWYSVLFCLTLINLDIKLNTTIYNDLMACAHFSKSIICYSWILKYVHVAITATFNFLLFFSQFFCFFFLFLLYIIYFAAISVKCNKFKSVMVSVGSVEEDFEKKKTTICDLYLQFVML